MPAYPRREIVSYDQIGVYHCVSRCVRRAFLCGFDSATGKNHDHRKTWIRRRLQQLASVFAIEVCGYAVLSNHVHVVLRVRPDLVSGWSDQEIALRWLQLFPPRDPVTRCAGALEEQQVNMVTSDPVKIAKLRDRLGDLSWFMRCLNEPIARAANREDECKGRFWEGRFRSQALLDEAAILACSVYVDLNRIRAGIAETPEESEFTSGFDRICSLKQQHADSPEAARTEFGEQARDDSIAGVSAAEERPDAWLCELTLDEDASITRQAEAMAVPVPQTNEGEGIPASAEVSSPVITGREQAAAVRSSVRTPKVGARASDQGFLPIELERYLSLLDWTGRQIRASRGGTIPGGLAPILERLGLNGDAWVETVQHFGRLFKRAAGRVDSLTAAAAQSGRRWLQGRSAARVAFQ